MSQAPIISAGQQMVNSSSCLISAAKSLAVNPKDAPTWQLLASQSKAVSDAIKKLMQAIKDKSPGQRECDKAIDTINRAINEVDQASLAAISQKLPGRAESTLGGFQEQMANSVSEISDRIGED